MTELQRLPDWLRKPAVPPSKLHWLKKTLRDRGLSTVCESARCPNIGECFSKPTATFMILGERCTRGCTFCSVDSSVSPAAVDPLEPENIALTSKELGLKHVVITSVTRDDLPGGGAVHFALTIKAIKDNIQDIFIEVLTPDFMGDLTALDTVLDAAPSIFNHNLETVPSLYPKVRPEADFSRSLKILEHASKRGVVTKSGIMVGLGESDEEIKSVLSSLSRVGCSIVTIGQYLRPTRHNLDVVSYIEPGRFEEFESWGKEAGIERVYSGPLVRSSYNADEVWKNFTE